MRKALLLALALTLVLTASNAYAIGISPGRIEVGSCPTCKPYTPGETITESFKAINNEDRELFVEFYASRDLEKYVEFTEASTTLHAREVRPMTFKITIPDGLSPGKHDTRIGLVESLPKDAGMLAARAGVEMQYWVYIPYPEKYLDMTFIASSAKKGEPVSFAVKLTSMGMNDIASASVKIEVRDPDGNLVKTINLDGRPIPSGKEETFVAQWTTSSVGAYTAKAVVTYDGETKEATAEFKVGDLLLQIGKVHADSVIAGKINKVVIEAESLWPERIEGVYAEVSGIGPAVKTETVGIDGWGEANLTAYVDATDVEPGTYDANVRVYYSGKTADKSVQIIVRQAGFAGFDMNAIIIIIAAIAILVLMLRKRRMI